MGLKLVESGTFEMMKGKFNEFSKEIKNLCEKNDAKEKWLDNEEVCSLLCISKRTLQSYRDRGILAYSQVGHKCFYRVSDIEKLLEVKRKKAVNPKLKKSGSNGK